ncbi:MAG: type VI secretion system baseplate subunit TssG [Candidatus Puniceispirillum sp.]|nr:type VI secretion system baseplate subunit TssG [Candidatus Puniceispirillum sp.]
MEAHSRKPRPCVIEELFATSYYFEFHQAVKLVELAFPKATELGRDAVPENEALSISARVSHSYPPSDLFSLTPPLSKDRQYPCQMSINFLGLAGPNGPLPMPFSELLMERARSGDTAFRDFLDIFNHRLLSIFHRIRKKYWVGLATDPPDKTAFAQILFSFLGIGGDAFRDRMSVPDRGLLYYAGLLWKSPRSTSGLEIFLSHYFNVPVSVTPFCGQWLSIPEEEQTCIGRAGRFQTLGEDASIGDKFWDTRSRISVQLGPLDDKRFRAFLPDGGGAFTALCELIRFYLGTEHSFDIRLVMRASDVEKTKIGAKTTLGWTSWLKVHPFTHDDDQVSLHIFNSDIA